MTESAFEPGTTTADVADPTLVLLGTPVASDTMASLVAEDVPLDRLLATVDGSAAGVVRIDAATVTVVLRGRATVRLTPEPVLLGADGATACTEHPLEEVPSIELAITDGARGSVGPPTLRIVGGVVPAARLVRAVTPPGAPDGADVGDAPDVLGAPAGIDGAPDPYDAMFGHTVVRTVEDAAVRAEPTAGRPALAVLLFSTGERVLVDQPVLLGRNPTGVPEPHRAVKLHGAGISRRHAAIHLQHWRALIDDLGSANGTEVTLPGHRPQRVTPGCPVGLVAGARVDLGGEVSFVVEEVS